MTGNRLGIDGLTVELKGDKGDLKLYDTTMRPSTLMQTKF